MFKKEIKKTNKAKNNRILCLNNTFYCKEHTLFNHQLQKRKLFLPGCTCTLHTFVVNEHKHYIGDDLEKYEPNDTQVLRLSCMTLMLLLIVRNGSFIADISCVLV